MSDPNTEDNEDAGGPAHPGPNFMPPKGASPETDEPDVDPDDSAGGPAHPGPDFMPPKSSDSE